MNNGTMSDINTPTLSDERFSEKTFETSNKSNNLPRASICSVDPKKSKTVLVSSTKPLTSFDALYSTIKRPVIDMFSPEGEFIASYRWGILKRFAHDKYSKELELELSKLAQMQNPQELLLTLSNMLVQFSHGITDSTKYVLCFYKGVAEYMLENYESAYIAYKYCYNLYDGDSQLYYNMGLLKMKCKQFYYAIDCLTMCYTLDPFHSFVANNLAYIYIYLSKYDEAARVCKRTFINNPKADNYFRNWAIALMKLSKPNKAVDAIKRGIDAHPSDAKNWLVWGEILVEIGDLEGALIKLRKAQELDPTDQTIKVKIEKMLVVQSAENVLQNKEKHKKVKGTFDTWRKKHKCNCSIF